MPDEKHWVTRNDPFWLEWDEVRAELIWLMARMPKGHSIPLVTYEGDEAEKSLRWWAKLPSKRKSPD